MGRLLPRIRRGALGCALVAILAVAAHAQFRASVQGTVRDTTDAVVSGATVTVTNQETAKEQTVAASEDGFYRVSGLPPGLYTVAAEAPGFKRHVVEGVNVIKRHTKPNPQRQIKGGVVEREAPLHASNVQLVCPECGKATRIGRKILGDGRKVRICRKCEGVVDK